MNQSENLRASVSEAIRKPCILLATHPRSGTHLTLDLLRRNFPALKSKKRWGEALDALYIPVDIAMIEGKAGSDRVRRLVDRHVYPIIKTHWLKPDFSNLDQESSDIADWLSTQAKLIYVIRQPKKVLASHLLYSQMDGQIDDLQLWFEKSVAYWCDHA